VECGSEIPEQRRGEVAHGWLSSCQRVLERYVAKIAVAGIADNADAQARRRGAVEALRFAKKVLEERDAPEAPSSTRNPIVRGVR